MATTGQSTSPDTVVLIHGLWMTPRSWEKWIERYADRGLTVIAPSWPGMEAENEDLKRDPSPIARQTVPQIVDHYERRHAQHADPGHGRVRIL
jgi:pimeloyl-ACP methyl ester carboxylesterase